MLKAAAPLTAALVRRVAALPSLVSLAGAARRDWGQTWCGGRIEVSLQKVLAALDGGPAGTASRSRLRGRQVAAIHEGNLPNGGFAMTVVAETVANKLGGEAVLGRSIRSQADLALAVRDRLPLGALASLARAGVSEREIERFVIPQRTRRHRAQRREPLTVEESDRAVRLLRLQTLAEETFGSTDKAAAWLRRPLAELGRETPLDVGQTNSGARLIETILAKIVWGAAA